MVCLHHSFVKPMKIFKKSNRKQTSLKSQIVLVTKKTIRQKFLQRFCFKFISFQHFLEQASMLTYQEDLRNLNIKSIIILYLYFVSVEKISSIEG